MPTFYEFFAGGGMARGGLGKGWRCLFANDIDQKKVRAYRANYNGGPELLERDIREVSPSELPGEPELIWASFPCQDLSLAGMGAGLQGKRSGTFWPFWERVQQLDQEGRAPSLVVLENVCGALTSHNGEDFRSLIRALRKTGYRSGALVIDAALFLPQSRPRLFIVGLRSDVEIAPELVLDAPEGTFHTSRVIAAYQDLPDREKKSWIWWRLPLPPRRPDGLCDLIEKDTPWHSLEQTQKLLRMMSATNLAKVEKARKIGRPVIGTVYRRTRRDTNGAKKQRAEVRFDDIAGCLRTPGGGSSRQIILFVNGAETRSRLLSPRETARLMGLSDRYILPENYNDAYHLTGDGVAVPVVRHLAHCLLEPLIGSARKTDERAA